MDIQCRVCKKPYNHHVDDRDLMVQLLKEDYWYPKLQGDPLEKVLCDHCGVELALRAKYAKLRELEG
jgi:uncharacterized protein YlaI